METLLIVFYCLAGILFISGLINKSYLLSLYIGIISLCDILMQLKQHFLVYPKPYTGTGFIFFCITTALHLFIPTSTLLFSIYSWTKKISLGPILAWLTACIFCLWNYPALRGQSMLNLFAAYYLALGVTSVIYLFSKAKSRFSFSQAALLLGAFGEIVAMIIQLTNVSIDLTFTVQNWMLICLSNCIFYTALIGGLWLNRVLSALRP